MKRSEINENIRFARRIFEKNSIFLPSFAHFDMKQWKETDVSVMSAVGMGWDVTDFGSDDFENVGVTLFTVRNGDVSNPGIGVPYAEKLIVAKSTQSVPLHFHKQKTEDIINRGGGVMKMKLYRVDESGVLTEQDFEVVSDGIRHTLHAGEVFELKAGQSITLTPYISHAFCVECAEAMVIGEVSSVNDDNADNFWAQPAKRFLEIEEDEPPIAPLCNEYSKL